jgi:hypothetical protein
VRLLVVCALAALGLFVAVPRTLRGPVFFPLRALAGGYTHTFRGPAVSSPVIKGSVPVCGAQKRTNPLINAAGRRWT